MLTLSPLLGLFLELLHIPLSAKPLYVSAGAAVGGDGNLSSPFSALQRAADAAQPDDSVFVMNGTYSNSGNNNVVLLTHSGTAAQWIVFIAYLNHKPRLSFTG